MTKRDDIHRPGLIDPADYTYLFSFSYPGVVEPGFNLALLAAVQTGATQQAPLYGVNDLGQIAIIGHQPVTSPWGKLPFFHKSNGAGGCDICGAGFRHGDVWQHNPTGEAVIIGHICAEKMGLVAGRGEWTRNQKEMAKLRKQAAYIAKKLAEKAAREAAAAQFLAGNPGLAEALTLSHRISQDLAAKLGTYGSLSPAQVALAFKLAAEASQRQAVKAEIPEILPPSGRVTIEGTVISAKEVFGPYGDQVKMTVEVSGVAGRFRVYGTAPAALLRGEDSLRGTRVRFVAEVKPKEAGFGFFNRPTSATRLAA